MPACWAPAGVGHRVPHQRRRSAGLAHGGARPGRARHPLGVDAGQRRVLSGAWIASDASVSSASASSAGAKPSRCASRAAAHQPSAARAARRAAAARRRARAARAGPRAAAARRASSSARRPAGRAARRGSSRRAGGRTRRRRCGHGASRSGKCSARCSRSTSRIQRRSSWRREAVAGEQLLLARDRLGAGDLPAHGEPLEQELDRALPGVLARERRAGRRGGVLAPRGRRHRAAQHEHVAVGRAAVLGLGRRATSPVAAAAAALPISSSRRALELRRDVAGERLGVARPGRARSRPRACAPTRAPARCRG